MYTVLRQKSGFLGYSKEARSYIIGFDSKKYAKAVCKTVSKSPLILLSRHDVDDISDQVNIGAKAFGVDSMDVTDLTIDTEAQLTITKSQERLLEEFYKLEDMDAGDFLCMPFERDLGVIMPYKLINETVNEYVFLSQVIDPCGQPDMFRKHLKMP